MNLEMDVRLLPTGVLLHQHILDIRWGDMDAFGHVNNIRYWRTLYPR